MKTLICILSLITQIAYAGLPPTTTKGSADSNPVTTFEIDMPNIPITHTGVKASMGVIATAGGGTGQNSSATFPTTGTVQATTPNNHGVMISGAGATATVIAPDASTTKVLTSGGSSADPTWASVTATVPTASKDAQNLGFATSVGSSALTIALKQADGSTDPAAGGGSVLVGFRSATAATGSYTQVASTAATSIVVPSSATLGHTSGVSWPIYVYAINNAGTLELAVSRTMFTENNTVTTTTIGAGSTSGTVMYSTTGRTTVGFRLIGRMISNQVTAGTWALVPTKIEVLPFEHGAISSADNVGYNIVSAQITGSNGTVNAELGGDWINGNCSHSTGSYTCTINGAIFGGTPNCFCSVFDTAGDCMILASTSTQVQIQTASTVAGAVADHDNFVFCMGKR